MHRDLGCCSATFSIDYPSECLPSPISPSTLEISPIQVSSNPRPSSRPLRNGAATSLPIKAHAPSVRSTLDTPPSNAIDPPCRGTRKVEGLCIESNTQPLMSEGFAAMTNIRLLKLNYSMVSGNFIHSFPDLRWLSWKGFQNIEYTPTNSRKLTVLDLSHGYISESWMGWRYIKVAENLKVLDLSCSVNLSQTPTFSANQQLEVLILRQCKNLVTIDASIGHLKRLVMLNMASCTSLKNLPTSIYELRSLKTLDITYTKISRLPEELGHLEALTELLINGTLTDWLPTSLGQLKNLKNLSAQYCKIQEGGIPDNLGRLSSLKYLNLNGNQFHSLPRTVSTLSLLQTLSLMCCDKLKSLPQLSNLANLKALHIFSCKNLAELPTMNALTRLESLDLKGCDALQYISNLPSGLKSLEVACKNVREISAFLDMRKLETLDLHDCPKLAKIESLEGLDSLQLFKISDCLSLTKLPNLQGLKTLRHLEFCNVGLAEIEGLEGLDSLVVLHLISIPTEILPCLSNLKKLKILSIDGCISIQTLPSLSSLKKLQSLSATNCRMLTQIQGVDELESLVRLNIRGCFNLKLPNSPNLMKLHISWPY
ncbi:hypothetical protein NE237_005333 [Protea cynaroides]|uniref:Disease resistance R13L4/SHOC-2-like LRR domain-containing protein n=1 Tax=Protea cynaroides TaxID=273540 RepID=A0A9Q0KL51_9MAGN|nr:hypothetical protein NE237_005333 [Protea cynaroides]